MNLREKYYFRIKLQPDRILTHYLIIIIEEIFFSQYPNALSLKCHNKARVTLFYKANLLARSPFHFFKKRSSQYE